MKDQDFEKLTHARENGKKIRGRRKDGSWTKAGAIEAGLGSGLPQDGVRLGIYNENGIKTSDEFLLYGEIDEIEIID